MSEIRADKLHNASGDNDSGIDLSTNDQVKIKTADTTRLTVASDGTVQVNDVNLDLLDTDGDVTGRFRRSAGTNSVIVEADPANSASSSSIQFRTDATERARIENSGRLLLGVTSAIASSGALLHINAGSSGSLISETSLTSQVFHVHFRNGNGATGGIETSGTSTAYATSSDYRLKENVTADWDATTRLKQLNPVRFNFIADADTTVDGFLAHEVQSVVPEAITGTHNAVDDDDNPVYQGIDQSKLVPLLVKTIQELEARITALESE